MSTPATDPIDEQLCRLFAGEAVDWKNQTIPAAKLRTHLLAVTGEERPRAITIRNARIHGDLVLDEIGECSPPLALQFMECRLAGFRAASSHWRQLYFGKTRLTWIDMPGAQVERGLNIEGCKLREWLDLRECRIGGDLLLDNSNFIGTGNRSAVTLTNSLIERDFRACNITARGFIKADRISVAGSILFDGAELDGRPGQEEPKALDLSRSRIGGMVQLAPGERRFVAYGRIHFDAAHLGALVVKAARLEGCGGLAIVGDECQIRETLDLSGLSDRGLPPLEVEGQVRFAGAAIGGQLQFVDVRFKSEDECVILYNCRVAGDMLIGTLGRDTRFKGPFNANMAEVGGRLLLAGLRFDAPGGCFHARQARVGKEVSVYQVKANGCLDFGNLAASGLELEDVELSRPTLPPVRPGMPDAYSQPEDSLLDLPFVDLRGDLRIEKLALINGNLRMMEASIGRGLQMSRIEIKARGRLAFIAQNARVGSSFYIAGTAEKPALIDGELVLLGARVEGDMTFINVQIGTPKNVGKLQFHNATIGTSVSFIESQCHGTIVGSGARIGHDLVFHSAALLNGGATCCDLRHARIGARLQWATTNRPEGEFSTRIEGLVSTDGATVGLLGWRRVTMAAQSALAFTNMLVERHIECEMLACEGPVQINLGGTVTPLLADHFGANSGWADAWLGLDNFSYGQLSRPAGGDEESAETIVARRSAWLAQRYDPASARPARHLAGVLRQQGLFEASRQISQKAFNAEGEVRPTLRGRVFARAFGLFFGHGLSGSRAAITVAAVWGLGVAGTLGLKADDLLVNAGGAGRAQFASCGNEASSWLYPLDVMVPLDLGEESRCVIGKGPKAQLSMGHDITDRLNIGATLPTAKSLAVIYRLIAWLALSLAIATWSGLFKRAGRE